MASHLFFSSPSLVSPRVPELPMAFSISFYLSFVNCLRPRSSTDWLFGQKESAQAYGTNNGIGHEIRRLRVSFSPKAQIALT